MNNRKNIIIRLRTMSARALLRLLCLAVAMVWVIPMHAQRVSPENARKAAQTVLQGIGGRCDDASELQDVTEALGFSHLYAFNGEKGYVVLAADNRVSPVLCFSEEGHIAPARLSEGMSAFLQEYEESVHQAVVQNLRANSETAQQWNDLIAGRTENLQTRESVGPLLSTTWGQEDPYNLQCPTNTEAGMRCTTGSVATAMAQIMKYWEHPKQGKGSNEDHAGDNLYLYGYDALYANFGETTYDWQHMKNRYGTMSFATDEEKQAVAELMFHCAVSVDMIFDYDGNTFSEFDPVHRGSHIQSEASYYKVGEAFSGNFYYKCPSYKERSGYSDEQWVQMIKDALTASPARPIHVIMRHAYMYTQYIGTSYETIGYVCDGYRTALGNEYIHVNWGTGGLLNSGSFNNGYFRIDGGFQDEGFDKAYFGIEPDSANVTVTKNHDWGTVTNGGRFPKGDLITLQAVPYNGRHFSRWTKNGTFASYSPEFTVKVEADVTYTAEFESDQCMITVDVNPTDGGTIIGAGPHDFGTQCVLQAEPNPGYAFYGWFELVDGEYRCKETNPRYPFHVTHDRNLTAYFVAANYTLLTTCLPPSWGNVTGGGSHPANSQVTVVATPTAGHMFMGWVENGVVVNNNLTYTFTLQSDRNLVAVFGSGPQSSSGDIGSVVTNADGSQGVLFHIDPSGVGWMVAMDDASEECTWGPTTNVQLLPDRTCENLVALEDVSGFMNTGLIRTELGTENDYAASQVDFDHGWYLPSAGQLRKLYSALPFVDSVIYQHGGTTISEETYWSSTEYSSSDAATPMFAMSNSNKGGNCRVRAIRNYLASEDNMVLALPDSPTRGTVSVYNNGVYSYGANAAVVAQPKAGYQFDHWSEEGLPVSYNHIYTFTFTHSRRLVAHFVVSGGIGTMVHNADGSEGVVFYVNPEGTEGLMVALEDASEGCQWGTNSNIIPLDDRPLNDIYALEDVSGFHNTGLIRTAQNADSTVYAAGVVDYENGWYLPASGELRKLYAALPMIETALVRAGGSTLTEGTYWSSTEYSTSDASTPMFSMNNTAKTSTCRVRAIRKFLPSGIYSLVAKSQDTTMGTASGSGTYEYNETVTVSAEANEGFVFESWTEDGLAVSYDATYQFPFTRNRVLVANFRVAGTVGEIVHNADGSTGVVFYQNAEGTEGWMVALNDVSEGCQWGPQTNINVLPDMPYNDVRVMEDVSGYRNTDLIRKVLGTNNDYAASVVDFDNGWYLPAAGQLRKLYAALPMIEESILNAGGSLLTEDAYWSSSEYNTSDAFSPMFSMSNASKTSSKRVRAIRTFNCSNTNKVRVMANDVAFGSVAGGGIYELGASVSVLATPKPNYDFDHWEEDGCVVSYDNYYTFEFTRTRTLVAVFVRENSVGSIVHNADGSKGVIFYTYPSGIGGLMVALDDDSEGCPWGLNEDVTILDNQSPSVVMDLLEDMRGKSNTNRIRQWYSDNPEYAACKTDYANGWYLPSAGQLRKLYAALPLIEAAIVNAGGTTMTEGAYWSSTEQSASNAWTPSFAMSSSSKTGNCRVRAIRSLTDLETITANVNIEGGGTVTGAGQYDHGQTCTLKAHANNSYAFLNWTCGGSVVSTDMEYSFTVLGSQTYTANFVANSCNITTSFEPVGGGTVTGAGVYGVGETCTLTATTNAGYTFYSWSSGNYEVSTEPTFSFEVTASAHYTAHFIINTYAVTATAFPEVGGTVSGAQGYTYGTTATLMASPSEGYTFLNWTENGEVISTSPTLQFVVEGERSLVAHFSADVYTVTAVPIPADGGSIVGDGDYDYGSTATLTAHTGNYFEFYAWFEGEEVLSYNRTLTFEVTEDREVFALFVENENAFTQTTTFASGWNWWSSYIELDDNSLQSLQEGLGTSGEMIKSQNDGYASYLDGYGWYGSLASINNESTYQVKTNAACSIELTGSLANLEDHPITLNNGWTWVGYSVSVSMGVAEALSGIAPQNGDMLKSQNDGFASYLEGFGWYGSLSTLNPGMGLMFKSNNSSAVTLVYPNSGTRADLRATQTADNNHWQPNLNAYADNMSVMAIVELDGIELQGDKYELAAFANGECRGSARLMYVEPVDRYMAFLTIAGDEAAELHFGLYNNETGTVVETVCTPSLQYETNAIVGSFETPYVVSFCGSTTGIDEWASSLQVFPNPVEHGQTISLDISAVETLRATSVQIINALGMVVETLHATSLQRIIAPETAGVYTLRISIEGKGTCYRKLMVR